MLKLVFKRTPSAVPMEDHLRQVVCIPSVEDTNIRPDCIVDETYDEKAVMPMDRRCTVTRSMAHQYMPSQASCSVNKSPYGNLHLSEPLIRKNAELFNHTSHIWNLRTGQSSSHAYKSCSSVSIECLNGTTQSICDHTSTGSTTNLQIDTPTSSDLVPPKRSILKRAVFTPAQRHGLELAFTQNAYITKTDRRNLAVKLALKDNQVKIWFQNRRMKWRNLRHRAQRTESDSSGENHLGSQPKTSSQDDPIRCCSGVD